MPNGPRFGGGFSYRTPHVKDAIGSRAGYHGRRYNDRDDQARIVKHGSRKYHSPHGAWPRPQGPQPYRHGPPTCPRGHRSHRYQTQFHQQGRFSYRHKPAPFRSFARNAFQPQYPEPYALEPRHSAPSQAFQHQHQHHEAYHRDLHQPAHFRPSHDAAAAPKPFRSFASNTFPYWPPPPVRPPPRDPPGKRSIAVQTSPIPDCACAKAIERNDDILSHASNGYFNPSHIPGVSVDQLSSEANTFVPLPQPWSDSDWEVSTSPVPSSLSLQDKLASIVRHILSDRCDDASEMSAASDSFAIENGASSPPPVLASDPLELEDGVGSDEYMSLASPIPLPSPMSLGRARAETAPCDRPAKRWRSGDLSHNIDTSTMSLSRIVFPAGAATTSSPTTITDSCAPPSSPIATVAPLKTGTASDLASSLFASIKAGDWGRGHRSICSNSERHQATERSSIGGGSSRRALEDRGGESLPRNRSQKKHAREPAPLVDKKDWVKPESLLKIDGKPPIWASNRQEVCETLPYFRSYQSGHYVHDNQTRGCLLDGCPSPRDQFADEGRVIISHCGGGSQLASKPGEARRYSFAISQTRDDNKRVEALTNCMHQRVPVALLAGRQYAKMPWLKDKADILYVVLGWYLPTHIWPEVETDEQHRRLVRFKVRFQWLSSQGDPWWLDDFRRFHRIMNRSDSTEAPLSFGSPAPCPTCGSLSPAIFARFVCLNEGCSRFFIDSSLLEAEQTPLSPALLVHQAELEGDQVTVPCPLKPESIQQRRNKSRYRELATDSFKGTHCETCGRLSRRIFWGRIACYSCFASFDLHPKVYAAPDLPNLPDWDGQRNISRITQRIIKDDFDWLVIQYLLPDGAGAVFHAQAKGSRNDADRLFVDYQKLVGPQSFKRNKLTSSMISGLVGQQYTLNCGVPYKFCTKVDTVPWADAPLPAKVARNLLNDFLQSSLQCILNKARLRLQGFNEVLSCCYVADGTMKYHSDDERGVGPVVASLSLGSPAVMRFKPKPTEGAPSSSRLALSLFLRHGDVVVQAGAAIQERWLHGISSKGFRIACTARHIAQR